MVGLLRALIGQTADPTEMRAFQHPGEPVSKARARRGNRGRWYTPRKSDTAEEALAWRFKQVEHAPLEGNVALAAMFYRPNRQRIDTDNLLKLVLDAGTRAEVWRDDDQVTAQAGIVELDAECPRTLIAYCPIESTMVRRATQEATCKRCGEVFTHSVGSRPRSYCSTACAHPLREASCPRCEQTFRRRRSGQVYCSKSCARSKPGVRRPSGQQRAPARCEVCGELVSRREYKRCRQCRYTK